MDEIKLLALFGKSSSGKDTIRNWLLNNYDVNNVISYTTRPRREKEVDGKDYYFITKDEFMKLYLKNDILNWFTFNGWYYGTAADSLDKTKLNVGVFSISELKDMLLKTEIDTLPVLIKANDKERLLRSINREKNGNYSEICRRFLSDEKDFENIDFYYETFLNDGDGDNFYGILNRPEVAKFVQGLI